MKLVSPDGLRALTWTDQLVEVWCLEDGRHVLRCPAIGPAEETYYQFLADGRLVAFCGDKAWTWKDSEGARAFALDAWRPWGGPCKGPLCLRLHRNTAFLVDLGAEAIVARWEGPNELKSGVVLPDGRVLLGDAAGNLVLLTQVGASA